MKHFDLNGNGLPLHFIHANGYPPECYKPLFELLKTEYRVFGMYLRPLWEDAKPEELDSWHPLTDDLLQFLASSDSKTGRGNPAPTPVIGVGHSIGGMVTLRAALRDPGKFRALVLIEPVIFIPRTLIAWDIIARRMGLVDRVHPMIAGAKKRRRTFDNLDIVFRGYRSRKIFRYMNDESLRVYIEGITKPSVNGGYELVYSPEWELQIYRTSMLDFDIWRDLPKLEVPTLILRGAETDTLYEDATRLIKRKQPKVQIETVNQSTHLLPLERPKEVFEIMQSFLKEVE